MTDGARKTALVTGATSGIGRAVARGLAQAGHDVLALGRNRAALDEMEAEGGIKGIAVDITQPDALAAALDGVSVDVLVNNAGMVTHRGPFVEADMAEAAQAIAVNLTAQLSVTRLVLPGMISRGYGHIFFTGSIAGHWAYTDLAVYAATKGGVASFAQSLRQEVYMRGVRVTEMVVGRVETGLYRDVLSESERAQMYLEGNAIQPKDVAQMVLNVLDMPPNADVVRFDLLPGTRPGGAA